MSEKNTVDLFKVSTSRKMAIQAKETDHQLFGREHFSSFLVPVPSKHESFVPVFRNKRARVPNDVEV